MQRESLFPANSLTGTDCSGSIFARCLSLLTLAPPRTVFAARRVMKRILSRSLVLSFCLLFSLPAVADAFWGRGRAPTYAITLSAENATVTATLTQNGAAAPARDVAFTWQIKGESGGPQPGPITATNAVGQAAYRWEAPDVFRSYTVTVTATLVSNPKVTVTTDIEVRPAFIALYNNRMNWADAKAWCRSRGGRLPLINNSDFFAWANRAQITHIDVFGAPGRPWTEVGLPTALYWTGTVCSDFPGFSWLVNDVGGNVNVINLHQSFGRRVVCVP